MTALPLEAKPAEASEAEPKASQPHPIFQGILEAHFPLVGSPIGSPAPLRSALWTAVYDLCRRYESGLDCAGADSDAGFFDSLCHGMRHDGDSPEDALLSVFARYSLRNGNGEVAREFLVAALAAAQRPAEASGAEQAHPATPTTEIAK